MTEREIGELEAKRGRDFHILSVGRANNKPFTILDKKVALEDPYFISPESFDLYFAEKNPEFKERLFLIRNFLKDPNLFKLITEGEFEKLIVGEYKSRKAIFLSLCSIWVKDNSVPINSLVSSESSAGKSFVCKNIIKIFPKELVEYRSKISAEAFTYWHTNEKDWSWDGMICYLEDISQPVLDSSTFKVMCSEGSIATVVRQQKAVDLRVEGKPCMLVTTARTNPSTEILNRFQIIQLDETEKQTLEITKKQALQLNKEEYDPDIIKSLSLLERKNVFIPYAEKIHEFLTKNYSFNDLRMRRDFSRLLDLIRCSTVLHQFQREMNSEGNLISTEQDYEIAREVINYITTLTLKGLVHKLKRAYDCCLEEKEFTAKDIHSKHPFVNQKMWYLYLDELCERGLLTTELKEIEGIKKRVTYFKVPQKLVFNLPEYSTLFLTNDTIDTIVTKVTIVTNDREKERTNVTNVTNVIENPLQTCIVCGSSDAFIVVGSSHYCENCWRKK